MTLYEARLRWHGSTSSVVLVGFVCSESTETHGGGNSTTPRNPSVLHQRTSKTQNDGVTTRLRSVATIKHNSSFDTRQQTGSVCFSWERDEQETLEGFLIFKFPVYPSSSFWHPPRTKRAWGDRLWTSDRTPRMRCNLNFTGLPLTMWHEHVCLHGLPQHAVHTLTWGQDKNPVISFEKTLFSPPSRSCQR